MLNNVNLPKLDISGNFDRTVCYAIVNMAKQCGIFSQIENDATSVKSIILIVNISVVSVETFVDIAFQSVTVNFYFCYL